MLAVPCSGAINNIAVAQSEATGKLTLSHLGAVDKLSVVHSGAADDVAVAQSEAADNLTLSRLGALDKLCQEAALTRCIAWRRSRGGVGLGPSGKQLHPATPELTAWQERPADGLQ